MNFILQCVYAFFACVGFGISFNIHRRDHMIYASIGGALGWGCYLSAGFLHSDIAQYFIAAMLITVYAEVMARILKTPVTTVLLVALLPLVPGGGIYNTMQHCLSGDTNAFMETGIHTLGIAGALAVAILMVSSVVRFWKMVRTR